jgi:hypothetical protein
MKKVLLLVALVASISVVGFSAVQKASKSLDVKDLQVSPANSNFSQVSASFRTDFSARLNQPKKAAAALTAKWVRPAGSLYLAGVTSEGGCYYYYFIVNRPLADITFGNQSTGANSYEWNHQFYDVNNKGFAWAKTTDETLTVSGLNGEGDSIPTLTAKGDTSSVTYNPIPYYYTKSTNTWSIKGAGLVEYLTTPDSVLGSAYGQYGVSPKPWFSGTRDKTPYNAFVYYTGAADANGGTSGSWFGTNAKGINGIAVAVEKPAYPYALTGARIFYRADSVTKDFNLTVNAYKLVKPESWDTIKSSTGADSLYKRVAPVFGDLLATGTALVPATTTAEETAGGRAAYAVAPFQVKNSDGTTEDVTLNITDPIIVTVTGYNCGSDYGFTTFITRDNVDEGLGENCYLYWPATANKWLGLTNFFNGATLYSAPSVFLDTEYPFIMYNYTNEDGQYTAPTTGGSEKIQYYASKSSDYWSFQLADGSDVPDWVTIAPADSLAADKSYSQVTNVTYTAAALPSGVAGRTAKINVSVPGSIPCYYTITQGTGGVNDVNANVSKVSVVGGNFVVNAVANDVVRIYNIAGQFIKQAQVSQGQTVIDGQEYAKGIYVVKFQNGKSYKVAK